MINTFTCNAFNILGIDVSATSKIILKRSKEILTRLNIGDIPEYEDALNMLKANRTAETVKEAIQKLQSPNKKIMEYFFWLQKSDDVDLNAFELIKQEKYYHAVDIWLNSPVKSFYHKKNLAIFYLLLLCKSNDKKILNDSLVLWKELVMAESFWHSFFEDYIKNDEQKSNNDILSSFQNNITIILADIYTELYDLHKDLDYIGEFQRVFACKSNKMDKSVFQPIFESINSILQELRDIELKRNAEKVKDIPAIPTINKLIASIKEKLNLLSALNIYSSTDAKIIRDEIAIQLRAIAIDLNNDFDEPELGLEFLPIAAEICGAEGLKIKLQDDIRILKNNIMENVASGKRKKIAPTMYTINGCGTKIYGDTLYFVILYIPICPLARYSLIDHGNGSYSFIEKIELAKFKKYWKYGFLSAIAIWVLIAFASSDSHSTSKSNSNSAIVAHNDSYSEHGQFRCSKEHNRKADLLQPNLSERQQLDATSKFLKSYKLEIDVLLTKIDSGDYLNDIEYDKLASKTATKIDDFNRKWKIYDQKIDEFNAKINAYNEYLLTYCTKRY